jgi:hypothetical protein
MDKGREELEQGRDELSALNNILHRGKNTMQGQ